MQTSLTKLDYIFQFSQCRKYYSILQWYNSNILIYQGQFTVELYVNEAPKTCENFIGLSKKGYYNGVIFHRIVKVFIFDKHIVNQDFVIQGGDPTGTGKGGDSIFGYLF